MPVGFLKYIFEDPKAASRINKLLEAIVTSPPNADFLSSVIANDEVAPEF
jgi:hypothetical protein